MQCDPHHGAPRLPWLPALVWPAWLPGGSRLLSEKAQGKRENSTSLCFQDKMCIKVKCSKCQKTTWKGKHVMNCLSLPCGRVSRVCPPALRQEMAGCCTPVRVKRRLQTRPRLFKKWITLSTGYIANQRITWFVLLTFIHWIELYPVDSVIQPLNNWGLVKCRLRGKCRRRLQSADQG